MNVVVINCCTFPVHHKRNIAFRLFWVRPTRRPNVHQSLSRASSFKGHLSIQGQSPCSLRECDWMSWFCLRRPKRLYGMLTAEYLAMQIFYGVQFRPWLKGSILLTMQVASLWVIYICKSLHVTHTMRTHPTIASTTLSFSKVVGGLAGANPSWHSIANPGKRP